VNLLFECSHEEVGLTADFAKRLVQNLTRKTFNLPDDETFEFKILLQNPFLDSEAEFIYENEKHFSARISERLADTTLDQDFFIQGVSFSIAQDRQHNLFAD
jgi:hypothetical protein